MWEHSVMTAAHVCVGGGSVKTSASFEESESRLRLLVFALDRDKHRGKRERPSLPPSVRPSVARRGGIIFKPAAPPKKLDVQMECSRLSVVPGPEPGVRGHHCWLFLKATFCGCGVFRQNNKTKKTVRTV